MLAPLTHLARRAGEASGAFTDACVIAYAVWTIVANGAVATGGNAHTLAWGVLLTVLVLLAFAHWLAVRPGASDAYFADLASEELPAERSVALGSTARMLALPLLTLVAWLVTRSPWVAYGGSALSCVALAIEALAGAGSSERGAGGGPQAEAIDERTGLYLLATLGACFTLLALRPRSDDTFYLRMALSVVDQPLTALLSLNTVHGPPSSTLGPQLMFPPYKVHSFELLGGILAYLGGMDAVRVIHFGLAGAFAFLLPFACARLFRVIAPRYVLFATAVVVSFHLLEGSASRGYANHAYVRLWHGKGVLLTVFVPLICAYGLRFAAKPTRTRFLLLAAAQIGGMGLSSTGIWLVPSVAMLAVIAGTPNLGALVQRGLGSLLSSSYVLGAGVWVMLKLRGGAPAESPDVDTLGEGVAGAAQAALSALPPVFVRLGEAIEIALGPARTCASLLGIAFAAVVLAPNRLGARLFAALLLVLALGFANPWLSSPIANGVTGATTYYRVFWLLPVPVALGLVCAALRARLAARYPERTALVLSVALLASFYLVAVDRLVISADNQAKLTFPPAVKLPPHARMVAQHACVHAPRGKYVLASESVEQQLPMVPDCGYPLFAAERWLSASAEEKTARAQLVSLVDGSVTGTLERARWFLGELARQHVHAIVVDQQGATNARLKSLVRLAGFARVEEVDWAFIYLRRSKQVREAAADVARRICREVPASPHVLAPFGVAEAIERKRCGAAVTVSANTFSSLSSAEFDRALALERLVNLPPETFARATGGWVGPALSRRGIDTLVLAPLAQRNQELRALLDGLGYRRLFFASKHEILRREPARGREPH